MSDVTCASLGAFTHPTPTASTAASAAHTTKEDLLFMDFTSYNLRAASSLDATRGAVQHRGPAGRSLRNEIPNPWKHAHCSASFQTAVCAINRPAPAMP